ncbi:NADH-quinone oxidoreductase subunit L [Pyrofollis japonicus]|uniref:NADH-quinone oxidoreductase subunit 5 family protein n=1 Tax=Pyrofollis japonicus TaxID=3060460 RepID=UPI00295C3914|nr:NADH-quinone oxidoreductase subunit L [Pyrofollis japonicus]BEP17356.1 NADH-quinone oxidoreductase subunit L [Pyrofollis japonicus]
MDAATWALWSVLTSYVFSVIALLLGALHAKWKTVAWTSVSGLVLSTIFAWMALASPEGELTYHWVRSLGVNFSLLGDKLATIMGVVVATLSLLIGIYSVEYIGEWGAPRYWFFYTFFVASMLLLVYAGDMITMFIGWEGTGLSSWALIGFYYDDREEFWVGDPGRKAWKVPMWFTPSHSGLRAIVFTRLGDIGMLIGFGMVYAVTGSTSIAVLRDNIYTLFADLTLRGLAAYWLLLFFMGALAKSAQFPFHEWLVTAMTGPTSVSALIHAATMVKAGVFYALRFAPILAVGLFAPLATGVITMKALAWLALLTAFATATMAIVARELKLILAYSTASQLSYMLGAVFAATAVDEAALGDLGGFSHLVSHAVFKAALFLAAGAIIHAVHSRFIDDMGDLRKYMPWTYLATLLAGLSLAAIPPFSGWWSKDLAVHAMGEYSWWLAFGALVTAVLTGAYTMRMIYYVFHAPATRKHEHLHEAHPLMLGPYLVLGLTALGLGLVWPWVEHHIAEAVGAEAPHLTVGDVLPGTIAAVLGASTVALYFAGVRPMEWVRRSKSLQVLYNFLYDRWYVNSVIYRLIVYPGARFAEWLRDGVEKGYDMLLHVSTPAASTGLGQRIRGLQSGDLQRYLAYFFAGILLAALISAFVIVLAG